MNSLLVDLGLQPFTPPPGVIRRIFADNAEPLTVQQVFNIRVEAAFLLVKNGQHTVPHIADDLGMSESAVRDYLTVLIRQGRVRVVIGPRRRRFYYENAPVRIAK